MTRAVLPLVVIACVALAGCDRALLDPAVRDGDEAALLRAAGLARPEGRYTLAGMVLEASRALGSESGAVARDRLAEFGREQAALQAAAAAGDSQAVAAARLGLRQAELAMVAEVLGSGGAERALAGVVESFGRARTALEAAGGEGGDRPELRRQQEEIGAAIAAARSSLEAGQVLASLDASTQAAEQLLALRRGVLDLDRVAALPELFARSERTLTAGTGAFTGGAELLANHARLKEAARTAVASGDRDRAHAALTAVRESELRITLEVLGPDVSRTVVADVGKALERLKPSATPSDSRLRRMLSAAQDLHFRAGSAMQSGDGVAALDLASYAAGLVNAYRLATAPF